MTTWQVKRIYEEPDAADGYRVLVDRLWPRGVSKSRARLDEWNKDVAPSDEARKAFGHRPGDFATFRKAYRTELDASEAAADMASRLNDQDVVTLLFSARDEEFNQAVVLAEYLRELP